LQAGGRRFDPVWLHQTVNSKSTADNESPNLEETKVPPAKSGGLIDIVKKGYAWRADGNVCAVRAWLCRYWSYPDRVRRAKTTHIGSELLTAELLPGLSR
jgi:hypothetical protein